MEDRVDIGRSSFRPPAATLSDRPLHLVFMPILAGLRDLPLASVDILVVWSTIIGTMIAIWLHYKWVAVAQVPYFVWVTIATVLQLSITWMNRM